MKKKFFLSALLISLFGLAAFTEELLGTRFAWIVEKVIDIGRIHQNLSISHKDDTVGNFTGEAHFMGS